jgi:WD40 repeat protein
VPASVAAVIRRLMAKHPDDRYREPAELAATLDQLARTGVLPRGHQPAPLREAACLEGHAGPVVAVAFTADGHTLLSAGADRTVRVWDCATRRERLRFLHAPHEIGCLIVDPVTGHVLTGQGVRVRILDLTGREVMQLRGHTDAVRTVAVSRDGRYALTGGDDRMLRLWDLHTGREVQRLAGHRAGITSAALSADGRYALSGGRDGILRLWEAGNGREVRTFAVPRGAVLGVAFAAAGTAVVSGHFDTTLRLWDLHTGKELRRLAGHRQMISGVTIAPEGQVVSASHDQTVRVWDPEGGCELGCGQGHTGPVTCIAVSPDGRRLASAGFDQTVRLWVLPGSPEGFGRG